MDRRQFLALATAGIGGIAGCTGDGSDPTPGDPTSPTRSEPTTSPVQSETSDDDSEERESTLHVAPGGSDGGPGTEDAPLGSIRQALKRAHPGDTIHLAPGEYREELRTVRSGESGNPITITGPPDAVWRGREGASVLLSIVHSHIHVTGITMNGLIDEGRAYEDRHAYVNTLVSISPVATHRSDDLEPVDYLEGVVLEPSRMGHCSSNMIFVTRLRDASIGGYRVVGPAGMDYHPEVENAVKSHVGERVYLGTGPDDMQGDHYPWDGLDRTRDVRIHHVDNSAGYHHSEMVDIKIGCENVTVEYCTDRGAGGQTDGVTAGAISPKSRDCTVRWNDIGECPVGIEFDPYAPVDDVDAHDWATDNAIYGNHIHDYTREALLFRRPEEGLATPEDQRIICGNRIDGPYADEYAYATGECRADVPSGDGIGHAHRAMPTQQGDADGGTPDLSIDASITRETVTVGDPIEVVVTVSNAGGAKGRMELVLGAEELDFSLASEQVEVPPGERKRVVLTTGPAPSPGTRTLTLNGDVIGSVVVEPEGDG